MCGLTDITVRPIGGPSNPADLLDYVATALSFLRATVVVDVAGFTIDGDVLDDEAELSPAPNRTCSLNLRLDPWTDPPLVKDDTSIRLGIVATTTGISQTALLDIHFLHGRLIADGSWEWFLSCGGAPNCDFCGEESPRQCA